MNIHPPALLCGILAAVSLLCQGCAGVGSSVPSPAPPIPFAEGAPEAEPTILRIPEQPSRPQAQPKAIVNSGSTSSGERIFPVWFGTNRKPVVTSNRLAFSSQRHNRTNYGRVDVFVPASHRFGETGNPFYKRILRGEFRDDHLEVREPKLLKSDQFYEGIRQMIQTSVNDGNESQALVFIHGFNVTFEEAAVRAAQIGLDLKVPGPTAFFSWPSLGSVTPQAYAADGRMIKDSEAALVAFLVEFAQRSGAAKINLIAHSMGNRGLLECLEHIAGDAQLRERVKFNQIILAAPDIDREVFLQAAQVYSQFSKRTTLYSSSSDRALLVAPVVGTGGPRAGYFKPYTVAEGVDTIAVPDFDVDQLGHSYFANAEALLYDINDLLDSNKEPRRRQRVSPFQADGKQFWKLQR